MAPIFLYVTCPDREEAGKIASALVEQRLVACANIMAPHEAVYQWKGKVESATEIAIVMKTRSDLFEDVKEAILKLHSYETPCIVALPIEKGHAPFLRWVEEETIK
jgi:periplasmic divalent cation tolerance protein